MADRSFLAPYRVSALLLALFAGGHLAAAEGTCALDASSMQQDLRQLRRELQQSWAYLDKRQHEGLELDGLFDQAAGQLDRLVDGSEFEAVLKRIIAAMADGHAFAYLPCAARRLVPWPFTIVDSTDGVLVASSSVDGVHPGDRLVAVQGIPIGEFVAARMAVTPAATPGARRALALASLQWSDKSPLSFGLATATGNRYQFAGRTPSLPSTPPDPPIESRLLSDRIGYLRIRSLEAPDQKRWMEAVTPEEREQLLVDPAERIHSAFVQFAGTKALILDLRGNFGGTDLLAMKITDALLPPGYTYYQLAGKLSTGWGTASPWIPRASHVPVYRGKLIVLIDELATSAADNLAACLRDLHPNVTFIGQPTAGSSGAPRTVTLQHSGAQITFCTMRVFSPRGRLIEGHGTLPDRLVRPTRNDVVARRDAALAAAVALASGAQ
jgi:C-terminal processing protease CtpA/Prc